MLYEVITLDFRDDGCRALGDQRQGVLGRAREVPAQAIRFWFLTILLFLAINSLFLLLKDPWIKHKCRSSRNTK